MSHPSFEELNRVDLSDIVRSHLQGCASCTRMVETADAVNNGAEQLVTEAPFDIEGDPREGGMSLIFKARDRRLGRSVIIKEPPPADGDYDQPGFVMRAQERIRQEGAILAQLQHPSIVTIYEVGVTSEGKPFLVLEEVGGVTLDQRLRDLEEREAGGALLIAERLQLLASLSDIAEALAYAHARGIVHRDVKPSNIVIGDFGEATLIDWGIAKDLRAADRYAGMKADDLPSASTPAALRFTMAKAGTPPYVSREQALGHPADETFDIYSLGATMYHVVAGKPPYPDEVEEFVKVVGKTIPPRPTPDRELAGLILKAMSLAPAERYAAKDLVTALHQYLTGELVFSVQYSLLSRCIRFARRHRALAALAGTTIVLAVCLLVTLQAVWTHEAKADRNSAEAKARAAELEARLFEEGAARQRERADALDHVAELERRGLVSDEERRAAEAARRVAEVARLRAADAEERAKGKRYLAEKARLLAEEERDAALEAKRRAEGTAAEAIREKDLAVAGNRESDRRRIVAELDLRVAEDARATAIREKGELAEAHRKLEEARAAAMRSAQVTAQEERERLLELEEEVAKLKKQLEDAQRDH
jgi:tRNA A-37 threonylcarbamoyl transferase component Bud32